MKELLLFLVTFVLLSACFQDPVKLDDGFDKINAQWQTKDSISLTPALPIKSLKNNYTISQLDKIVSSLHDINKELSQYNSPNALVLSEWISLNLSLADYLNNEIKFLKLVNKSMNSFGKLDANNLTKHACFSDFDSLIEKSSAMIDDAISINLRFAAFYNKNYALFESKQEMIDYTNFDGLRNALIDAKAQVDSLCEINSDILAWINSFGKSGDLCSQVSSFEQHIIKLQGIKSKLKNISGYFSDAAQKNELDSRYAKFDESATEFGELYASLKFACESK